MYTGRLLLSQTPSCRQDTTESDSGLGICSLPHSIFGLKISLYKRATMSNSFTLLFKKERLWAIHSCPFLQMNWIPCVALYKRVTMSNLLRALMTKVWLWAIRSDCSWQKSDGSNMLFFASESLFCSQKPINRLKNWWANSQNLVRLHHVGRILPSQTPSCRL